MMSCRKNISSCILMVEKDKKKKNQVRFEDYVEFSFPEFRSENSKLGRFS